MYNIVPLLAVCYVWRPSVLRPSKNERVVATRCTTNPVAGYRGADFSGRDVLGIHS